MINSAKISTITYVHDSTERLAQDYMVKEIIAVSRTDDNDVTKVISRLLFHLTEIYQPKLTILKHHIFKKESLWDVLGDYPNFSTCE
ncbi:hypothetical protein GLOIN_2v93645 [Rhizophagus irregularis DAOM 181602=DAOM 197198]|nr:hypothetical protein GLOIN_2v93645 [Rhizophagus irregularis DAOM 181602=DAOM 197198]